MPGKETGSTKLDEDESGDLDVVEAFEEPEEKAVRMRWSGWVRMRGECILTVLIYVGSSLVLLLKSLRLKRMIDRFNFRCSSRIESKVK